MRRESTIRWPVLIIACLAMAAMFFIGQRRLKIDTDITSAVPDTSPAFSGAKKVLERYPSLDTVVIDLSMRDGRSDPNALVEAADALSLELTKSQLFSRVGTADAVRGMVFLFSTTPKNLPALFSREEIDRDVVPRLDPKAVDERIADQLQGLTDLSGIGTISRLAGDPVGLSDLVLARLAALIPNESARIDRGHVISLDGRHVLVSAIPRETAMDTRQAHAIAGLLGGIERSLDGIAVTAVGGYRAAIDNETMVIRDMNRALTVSTVGIAILLLLCFPRPWLGVFALLPAIAGACAALFVYSFMQPNISALALGFGGALVSITVDQGAVYLLFVDRESRTEGHRAAHEVFSIGALSTLINIGSFLALWLSGFRLLGQLGLFAALGIGSSYLFVHLVFPHIFPSVPPARRPAWLPVDRILKRATVRRGFVAVGVAAVLFVAAIATARPTFVADVAAMNTVSAETAQAEARVKAVWGDVFQRIYVLLDAADPADLQRQSDRWLELFEQQRARGVLSKGFSPSMLTPGERIAERNRAAWASFWTDERIASVERTLRDIASSRGFTNDAFDPFLAMLRARTVSSIPLSDEVMALYGASKGRNGKGTVWLGSVTPGQAYEPGAFARQAAGAGLSVFDGTHFSHVLATFLGESFLRMLVIIVGFVGVCVTLFFLDLRIAALALSPLAFAFVCTLGTLSAIGKPIDVPGLMLAILIFGMGVDYSFSFVRVYQRCLDEDHPSHGPVRTSIFLASSATLIGMVTLCGAGHAVARSAGVSASIAVAFCAVGAFVILPPVLRLIYAPRPVPPADPARPNAWVARRLRGLSGYPRVFAWFKLRLDPMFPRLGDFVPEKGTLLDIGCGHGVADAWLLANSDLRRIVGIEPDEDRARTAHWILGDRGEVHEGAVPGCWAEVEASAVLCLDVVHNLDDADLARTFSMVEKCLVPGGRFVMRATVPAGAPAPFQRWFEQTRLRLAGRTAHFRSADALIAALERAGMASVKVEPTHGREETWFIAERRA
jgi:predicted exporter